MAEYVNGRLKEELMQEKILRELEKFNATSVESGFPCFVVYISN